MTKHGLSIMERIELHYVPEPNSGCWIWTSGLAGNGYASMIVAGKSRRVHRIMYEIHKGPIPKGLEIRHSCDVRCCVNPEHLLVGTHLANMQDASLRKRFPCRRGENGATTKLTEAQVLSIRADSRGANTLAKEYNIDRSLIWMIRTRRIWTHI